MKPLQARQSELQEQVEAHSLTLSRLLASSVMDI
jgi:hypothetical protein